MKLTKNRKYDLNDWRCDGWYNPKDINLDGYLFQAYFDAYGRYLGPDKFNVEPDMASS